MIQNLEEFHHLIIGTKMKKRKNFITKKGLYTFLLLIYSQLAHFVKVKLVLYLVFTQNEGYWDRAFGKYQVHTGYAKLKSDTL